LNAIAPMKRAVKSTLAAVARWRVPYATPTVLRALPHDASAFTQGLAHVGGLLYESTGGFGTSSLRCIDPANGSIAKVIPISDDFTEGIAVHQGLLYQLSWKSGRARVYRLPDLLLVGEHYYPGDGWGLCSGPAGLMMSDGSGALRLLDPQFRTISTLRVTLNGLPTRRLNDLEQAGDEIYANVLFSTDILQISASDGRVTRIIDCAALRAAVAPVDVEHCLNGIAFNPLTGTFFLTGKCWNTMFEVTIPNGAAPYG
jgi:glutaminyl-peptide cyclotransferase